jgi:hypothetical protein
MAKEPTATIKVCDFITKYCIYALIFLMSVFFLPWTADVLDFNKQTLVILLAFVSLFAWMLRTLVSGKLEINLSKIHIAAGVLFLIYLLATLFSVNRYGSFWGWPQSSLESLLSLMGLLIFYFLVSNTFSKKNTATSLVILFISSLIAELIGVFQLLGLYIIPFAFAKSIAFNTIGSAGSLGFFAAILLPLSIVMLIASKKWWKILFSLQLVLSALILFLINYPIIWWIVIAGSAIIMIFGIVKRNIFDGRWMALPMFFLAVSIFFVLLNPQIPWMSPKTNEIFLSQKASLDISLQAIKERPVFGSGPGTFSYDFLKFKDPDFNKTSLWNTPFGQASSKALTDLASVGVLGFIALLALIFMPIFYGVKYVIFEKISGEDALQKETAQSYWLLILGILAALVSQAVMYFLYNSNMTLSFLHLFMIAALVALMAVEKTEYHLKPSSLMTLAATFVFTLVFIFGLGLLILNGQRYVADVNYYMALSSWQSGNKEGGKVGLEKAASLNSSSDLYFKQLSQAYLLILQDELKTAQANPSDAEKSKVQALISNSINAAKIATDLNPKSASDWSNRGYIYQSLYGCLSEDCSLTEAGMCIKIKEYCERKNNI